MTTSLGFIQSRADFSPHLKEAIANGVQWHFPSASMAYNRTAKALLKAIDTPQIMAGQCLQINGNFVNVYPSTAAASYPHSQLANLVGDAPEVITCGTACTRPAHRRPLQRMVRHP